MLLQKSLYVAIKDALAKACSLNCTDTCYCDNATVEEENYVDDVNDSDSKFSDDC